MTVTYEYKQHLIEQQAKSEELMLEEFHQGHYTMEDPLIKVNPYLINPLAAVILFETEEETAITVRVKGKKKEQDFYHSFGRAKEHVLPIIGLYSDYENQIEIYPWQKYDEKVTVTIQTEAVKQDSLVESMETTPAYMQDNVLMMGPAISDLAMAVDSAGDVRMALTVPMAWDIKRQKNGNLIMGSERVIRMPYFVSGLYEFSPVGKIYREVRVPRGYHHDQVRLPNGDFLALSCDIENGTVEDQLLVIDGVTGHEKRHINYRNFIRPGASKSGSWSDEDWFHCNAVWYDENTHSITLSGRHINAMVNIDFDTEKLNWIISDPEGWPEEYHPYIFKPKGDKFEWPYEQHAVSITPLGDVMCFDNHHYGSSKKENYLAAKDSYSRGVKYRIDTDTMEIEQIWQYGKERGSEFFSPYICNTTYYNEGHYLIHSGGIAYDGEGNPSEDLGPFAALDDPNAKMEAITVEVANGKKELELRVASNYYRATKMPLYAKAGNNLSLGRGTIQGSLGITSQIDLDIPCEETGEDLPKSCEGRIVDEMDMFTFYAKFESGQMVLLVLEGEKETRRYFISTSKGKRGAMCTGTFLPGDDRDTRTAVSKEGLEGTYKVSVIVDDKKYQTGITIHA